MKEFESFYEIELKALLSKDQYESLSELLNKYYVKINDDVIHTTRYRPGDVRLEYSNRIFELICRDVDVSKICRKELKLSFDTKEEFDNMVDIFKELKLQTDSAMETHKQDFEYILDDIKYIICLQDIKNFAYVLEVEVLTDEPNTPLHEKNIRTIFANLKVQAIDPKEFNDKITRYIWQNKKWL
jgi:hypothetical protein